jgi:hypothetical protein
MAYFQMRLAEYLSLRNEAYAVEALVYEKIHMLEVVRLINEAQKILEKHELRVIDP